MESSALALRVIRQTNRPVWRPEFALVVAAALGLWVPDQTGLGGGAALGVGMAVFVAVIVLSRIAVAQAGNQTLEWDGTSLWLQAFGSRRLVTQRGGGRVERVPERPGSRRPHPATQVWMNAAGATTAILRETNWPLPELEQLRAEVGIPVHELTGQEALARDAAQVQVRMPAGSPAGTGRRTIPILAGFAVAVVVIAAGLH